MRAVYKESLVFEWKDFLERLRQPTACRAQCLWPCLTCWENTPADQEEL